MSMDSNVKAVTITSTGVAYALRAHLRGILIHTAGAQGTLTLKDSTGATLLNLITNANSQTYMLLPGRGILFETNINCTTFASLTSVTLFYEG
jgi:hypothetical protein